MSTDSNSDSKAGSLFELWVEHLALTGRRLAVPELCAELPGAEAERAHVRCELEACIAEYDRIAATLEPPALGVDSQPTAAAMNGGAAPLPSFSGFRTIERIGRGGSGEVYKLEDLRLGRLVAGKTLRADGALRSTIADFLAEARSLALFDDPRIVRLLDYRETDGTPLLLMEYVEGFDLLRTGRSLDFKRRAEIVAEVAEAVHHAHILGVQHRDLKPSNILLDAQLRPRILDFGLSAQRTGAGHFRGTLPYMAPELLDRTAAVDKRCDVYALGVVLYELLCGRRPFEGADEHALVEAIRRGEPKLPVEVDGSVPEPLQAIALKAMEPERDERYQSAEDLALELRRFAAGRAVTARPRSYRSTLEHRLRHHLEEIREWRRLHLVYPHEVTALEATYRRLEDRDEDWIVQSRRFRLSRITLYLGVFLVGVAAVQYFVAYVNEGLSGVGHALAFLGVPFVALWQAARVLFDRDQKGTAVACYLASSLLLPTLLLVLMPELGLLNAPADTASQLMPDGPLSNHQLQGACLVSLAWACWLALRTRTVALSSSCTLLAGLGYASLLSDLGLRSWFEDANWDRLAIHWLPLLAAFGIAALAAESSERVWFARPLYFAGAVLLIAILELMALDGEVFRHLGLSLEALRPAEASQGVLETVVTMVLNGVVFYLVALALERWGTPIMALPARLLFVLAPFAILKPLLYLSALGQFSVRYDWAYLVLSLGMAVLSHHRERRSFYYAGLINSACAIYFITAHNEWWDRPWWAVAVLFVGLGWLVAGGALVRFERLRARD